MEFSIGRSPLVWSQREAWKSAYRIVAMEQQGRSNTRGMGLAKRRHRELDLLDEKFLQRIEAARSTGNILVVQDHLLWKEESSMERWLWNSAMESVSFCAMFIVVDYISSSPFFPVRSTVRGIQSNFNCATRNP